MNDAKSTPIFLSYARIDNEKDEHDKNQGWIEYFHSRLRLALSPKLGKRVEFWRDVNEIEKGKIWHEEIKQSLDAATVLIPILSPSFFASENCQFEVQHFIDHHKKIKKNKLGESVLKIAKHKIDLRQLPLSLRESEAFEFFVKDPEKGELSYYTPAAGLREDRKQAFMDELERLANRLAALLKEIGEVTETPPVATVFLAIPYPGSALGELYQRIKAELERRNVKVVPDRTRFFADLDVPDAIVLDQAATNARLAVHLLEPTAGMEAMRLDERQIDATAMRAEDANLLKRLIWVRDKPADTSDNALVASLRRLKANGGRLVVGDMLVEDSSERFIELIIRILFPVEVVHNISKNTAVHFVIFHSDDETVVRPHVLRELGSRGLSCRVPLPPHLESSNRVAIYWGSKGVDWLFKELDRLTSARSITLVKGPPASAEKAAFFADEVAVTIDLTDFVIEGGNS